MNTKLAKKLPIMKANDFEQFFDFIITLNDYYQKKFPDLNFNSGKIPKEIKQYRSYKQEYPYREALYRNLAYLVGYGYVSSLEEKNYAYYAFEFHDIVSKFVKYLMILSNLNVKSELFNNIKKQMSNLAKKFNTTLNEAERESNTIIPNFFHKTLSQSDLLVYDENDELLSLMENLLKNTDQQLVSYSKLFTIRREAYAWALLADGRETLVSVLTPATIAEKIAFRENEKKEESKEKLSNTTSKLYELFPKVLEENQEATQVESEQESNFEDLFPKVPKDLPEAPQAESKQKTNLNLQEEYQAIKTSTSSRVKENRVRMLVPA